MGRSHASGKAERGAKAAGKDRSPDASPSQWNCSWLPVKKEGPRHPPNCGVSSPEHSRPSATYAIAKPFSNAPGRTTTWTGLWRSARQRRSRCTRQKIHRSLQQRRDHHPCALRTSSPESSHRFLRQTSNTASKARLMAIHRGAIAPRRPPCSTVSLPSSVAPW